MPSESRNRLHLPNEHNPFNLSRISSVTISPGRSWGISILAKKATSLSHEIKLISDEKPGTLIFRNEIQDLNLKNL